MRGETHIEKTISLRKLHEEKKKLSALTTNDLEQRVILLEEQIAMLWRLTA